MSFISNSLRYITLNDKNYTREAVYDTVYFLRVLIALTAGITFGFFGFQGLPFFMSYMAMTFVGVTSWLNAAGINVDEYDSETAPLTMEGFPQGLSLFVLTWVASFTLAGHGVQ